MDRITAACNPCSGPWRRHCLGALLAGSAAAPAMAQSSVTLFGVVDQAISHYRVDSRPAPGTAPGSVLSRSLTALTSSGYHAGRLGMRGSEDLGAGLKAGFWLEVPVRADSGEPALRFSRRSTISLSGTRWGEWRMGRDFVPTFWNENVFDPFTTNGAGANLVFAVHARLATLRGAGQPPIGQGGSDNHVRANNSIGYFLPSLAGGWHGNVQYAFP